MAHPPERDWMIVAPWWQWTGPAGVPQGEKVTPDLAKGRLSVPVFQKYDSPKLVNEFIKDPQKRLKFVEEDLVHALRPSPDPVHSKAKGKSTGRDLLLRISASWGKDKDGNDLIIDRQYLPDGTNTRKIFLDSHKRFYLVVCQIHCDGPGFPKAARQKICEAGFVVRRRRVEPSDCAMQEAKPTLLEPIMNVEIQAPGEFAGDLMGDLNSRRGRISGSDSKGNTQIIRAQVPMSEMLNYQNDLISMTQGRASFTMEFSHYDFVPAFQAEKIIAAAKAAKSGEEEEEE